MPSSRVKNLLKLGKSEKCRNKLRRVIDMRRKLITKVSHLSEKPFTQLTYDTDYAQNPKLALPSVSC